MDRIKRVIRIGVSDLTLKSGVTRGSTLSPEIFRLVTNDFVDDIFSNKLMFTHDINLFYKIDTQNDL